MLETTLTRRQKYAHVMQNSHKFPHDLKLLGQLSIFQQDDSSMEGSGYQPSNYVHCIALQTYYKCCVPALYSFSWETPHFKVQHPVTAIVAFKEQGQEFYTVDMRVASWAESGGTRLTPLRANVSKDKIADMMKQSHALIVPEFKGQPEQSFFEKLSQLLKEHKQYPVIAIGNSALMILSLFHAEGKARKNLHINPAEMSVYFSHSDALTADMDLETRLAIQNRGRVLASSIGLSFDQLKQIGEEKIKIVGVGKGRSEDWWVVAAKEGLIHYLFLEVRPDGCLPESIKLNHKLLSNFLEEVRSREKLVEEKGLLQIGQFKVMLREQRYLYNLDVKLSKV